MAQNLATTVMSAPEATSRAGVLRALAERALEDGSPRRAVGLARSAVSFATRVGDHREEGLAWLCVAEALDVTGHAADAVAAATSSAGALAGQDEAAAEARARAWIAVHCARRDPERAAEEAVRARRLLELCAPDDPRWARAAARVATAEARLGAPDRAAELARTARGSGAAMDTATVAELQCRLAIASADEADQLARDGRGAEARARREEGLEITGLAPRTGAPEIAIERDLAEGRLAAGLDRPILALARLGAAATAAEAAGLTDFELMAHTQLSRVLLRVGSWTEAMSSLERAEAIADDAPSALRIGVLELRERILAIDGRAAHALPTLRAALTIARQGCERERTALWDEARVRVDLAESEQRGAALARLSRLDPLTGVPNRRAWDRELPRLVAAADPALPLTVAIVDLDHFKQVNDDASHLAGDAALRRVAGILATRLRQGDLVARLGGDEFGVAIVGHDPTTARSILERLRAAVAEADWSDLPARVQVTVSIGAAHWSPGTTAELLLTRADEALYAAKDRGRDRVATDGRLVSEV